jgi:hypothetical protein
MLAQIIRYLATLLTSLADWIQPPTASKRHGMYAIKDRKTANDVWLTPLEVASDHISTVAELADELNICTPDDYAHKWVDPFRNTGIYYDNFPQLIGNLTLPDHLMTPCVKDWCEIQEGRDALEYDYTDAIVCSNPPYSMINKCLKKMTKDRAQIISILGMTNHITAPRLQMMKDAGYELMALDFYNVKGYMMTATAMTWVREDIAGGDQTINFKYKRGGFKVDQSQAMRVE